MLKTPVLLITFNRPDFTRRVLTAIMAAEPEDLYVFQDGPRADVPDDEAKLAEVRWVVDELTEGTRTRVHERFATRNLGCGPGPAAGLSWYFGEVEQGIVIEDDAVPHPDFFAYAEELLQRYADNERVMAIASMNVDRVRPNKEELLFLYDEPQPVRLGHMAAGLAAVRPSA